MTDDRQYRKEFYPAVDQRQALDDRQSMYYVPIYDRPELARVDAVRELANAIEFSAGESVQLLSGFRGSGKTSELLRLADDVRAGGRAVVYMDIEDYFNTAVPPELARFPIALAAGFVLGSGIDPQLRHGLRERLVSFFKRLNIEPSFSVGTDIASADIKISLRDDNSLAAQIADVVRNNRRAFRAELHEFFADATAAIDSALAPLFIVDSVDHFRGREETFPAVRNAVEQIFTEFAEELCLPGLHVIYTVPVYVQSSFEEKVEVLNIKVADESGTPVAWGMDALRDVLVARAPGHDAERLLGGLGDRLLLQSGGLVRDVLRLTGRLIQTARSLPATTSDLTRCEMVLRSDFEGVLTREKVQILRRIRDSRELTPTAAEWSDTMDLMTSGAILKYPNGERAWYGVHPLLRPLLGS